MNPCGWTSEALQTKPPVGQAGFQILLAIDSRGRNGAQF